MSPVYGMLKGEETGALRSDANQDRWKILIALFKIIDYWSALFEIVIMR